MNNVAEVTYVKTKFTSEVNEWLGKQCLYKYYLAVPKYGMNDAVVLAFYEQADAIMFRLKFGIEL